MDDIVFLQRDGSTESEEGCAHCLHAIFLILFPDKFKYWVCQIIALYEKKKGGTVEQSLVGKWFWWSWETEYEVLPLFKSTLMCRWMMMFWKVIPQT